MDEADIFCIIYIGGGDTLVAFASRRYGYFEVLVQAYASPLPHAAHVSKRSIGYMEVSLERANEWLYMQEEEMMACGLIAGRTFCKTPLLMSSK